MNKFHQNQQTKKEWKSMVISLKIVGSRAPEPKLPFQLFDCGLQTELIFWNQILRIHIKVPILEPKW